MSIQDLHGACKLGDINGIKLAFDSNPEKINEKDTQLGWSPLYRTVISGHINAAKFLLEQGADPNISNNLGETPLHQAADNGNSTMAKLLISFGAQTNHQQNEGDTPLHHSAFRGDPEMVELLLEARASPNIRNKVAGRTPLHYAVDCGFLDCVEIMIRFKADPFIQDNMAKTAFDLTNDDNIICALSKRNSDFIGKENPDKNEDFKFLKNFVGQGSEDYDKCEGVFGSEDFYCERVSGDECEFSMVINRGSFSIDKISEFMKGGKVDTTAVSSHRGTSQKMVETYAIYDWLEKIQLAQYYDVIVSAGYTSLDQMIKDIAIASKMIITYIPISGHRRRLLFHLCDEEENKNKKIFIYKKPSQEIFKCCGISGGNTQGFYSIPSLLDWLKDLHMENYLTNFVESGYDSYESLIMMSNSEFALNEETIIEELNITNRKHIQKILKRIEIDHLNFCSRLSIGRISFDEPKSIACESCVVF
ncbi:hypothetical protein SteCoe_24738 [Stentor coeruleus]|uniref:NAD(+) ADP-ribosyltransferase n=1 Tax=Stentor coeruleus TaxID=5963 RepID=A0A1R2BGZ4_9CILI|nr:hypothetical protein SteCoe_24738 [Stentor coeruleus]